MLLEKFDDFVKSGEEYGLYLVLDNDVTNINKLRVLFSDGDNIPEMDSGLGDNNQMMVVFKHAKRLKESNPDAIQYIKDNYLMETAIGYRGTKNHLIKLSTTLEENKDKYNKGFLALTDESGEPNRPTEITKSVLSVLKFLEIKYHISTGYILKSD